VPYLWSVYTNPVTDLLREGSRDIATVFMINHFLREAEKLPDSPP
jgi:hypothetical protein